MKFTICSCLYGEYTSLAKRCLSSILALPNHTSWNLRIGMNAVGDATLKYVSDLKAKYSNITTYRCTENHGKYALMRWMFHDTIDPITTDYIVWFDDDSYITDNHAMYLSSLDVNMPYAAMCGRVASVNISEAQQLWITMQPWYNGKTPLGKVERFALGGWWCIRPEIVKKLNWPPENIVHLGGDYMLGEACRQHDLYIRNHSPFVKINADMNGNEHKAQRRGNKFTVACGNDYDPPSTVLLHDITKTVILDEQTSRDTVQRL